jgi:hypothetical protein
MDNHGKPKQINGKAVCNITKFLIHDRLELSIIPEPNTNSLPKKRKELLPILKKGKERNSIQKTCYYSWTCYYSLRAFVTSFTIGDMEHLRTSFGILVSFVIFDSYGSFLLGGEMIK